MYRLKMQSKRFGVLCIVDTSRAHRTRTTYMRQYLMRVMACIFKLSLFGYFWFYVLRSYNVFSHISLTIHAKDTFMKTENVLPIL